MNNKFFAILFCTLMSSCSDVLASESCQVKHCSKNSLDFSNHKNLSDSIQAEVKSVENFQHVDLKAKFIKPKFASQESVISTPVAPTDSVEHNVSAFVEGFKQMDLKAKFIKKNPELVISIPAVHIVHDSIDVFNSPYVSSVGNCTERSVSTGSMSRSSSRVGSVSPRPILKSNSSASLVNLGTRGVSFHDGLISPSQLVYHVANAFNDGNLETARQLVSETCNQGVMTTQKKGEILDLLKPIADSMKHVYPHLTYQEIAEKPLTSKQRTALTIHTALQLAPTASTDDYDRTC